MKVGELILRNITGDEQSKAQEMLLASQAGVLGKVSKLLKEVLSGTSLLQNDINKVERVFIKKFSKEILKLEK